MLFQVDAGDGDGLVATASDLASGKPNQRIINQSGSTDLLDCDEATRFYFLSMGIGQHAWLKDRSICNNWKAIYYYMTTRFL